MRTTLRRIGNSRGVIIPAALLNECGLSETVELRLDGSRLVIEPVKHRREDWFQGYDAAQDGDAWDDLPPDADAVDWEW
ncbi:MAG: AbrB/MazE/SpoVT family DNA-binding domain-containing protein [Halochromatium sp.]